MVTTSYQEYKKTQVIKMMIHKMQIILNKWKQKNKEEWTKQYTMIKIIEWKLKELIKVINKKILENSAHLVIFLIKKVRWELLMSKDFLKIIRKTKMHLIEDQLLGNMTIFLSKVSKIRTHKYLREWII